MAHYDKDTEEFMDSVAGRTARQAVGVAKDISKGHPVTKSVAKRAVGIATRELLEKEAGISVLSIYSILNQDYGNDWHEWEPETIWQTLETDHGISPSSEVKNIIQALQVVCKTNFPFEDWNIFENVGHAFNGNDVNFSVIQPLEMDEIAKTIKVLSAIRPKQEYEPEVCGYIAACAKSAGMVWLAPELFGEGCQSFLDEMNNDIELKEKVKSVWPAKSSTDEMLSVQLGRLHEVKEYLNG